MSSPGISDKPRKFRFKLLPTLKRGEMWLYFGPAFVASVAYIDPGNFASNFEGGARFGYTLLWVLLWSNAMAILIQYLSAKLGIATGKTLPIRPRNCRSELIPIAACATASATSSPSVVSGGRPPRAGPRYSSANTYAATTRASRSVISSSNLEGTQVWKPFFVDRRVPANPPTLHIKPLVGASEASAAAATS